MFFFCVVTGGSFAKSHTHSCTEHSKFSSAQRDLVCIVRCLQFVKFFFYFTCGKLDKKRHLSRMVKDRNSNLICDVYKDAFPFPTKIEWQIIYSRQHYWNTPKPNGKMGFRTIRTLTHRCGNSRLYFSVGLRALQRVLARFVLYWFCGNLVKRDECFQGESNSRPLVY